MKDSVVELVERALTRFRRFREENPQFFPAQDNLYPIPFFGDIRRAAVLTLALNPAWTEFRQGGRHERHWMPGLDAYALTTRLLHYFDLPTPSSHRWFKYRRKALAMLNCSYETNTAHIDLHPLPTKFRQDLTETQCKAIGQLIETRSEYHLANLLKLAKQVQLILVIDYTFSKSDGTTCKTSGFISSHPRITELLQSNGNQRRIFYCGGTNQVEQQLRLHRDSLRRHLRRTCSRF